MDDVRQLLHHLFEVALQTLMVLELVFFDETLVYVQSHAAGLHEAPAAANNDVRTEHFESDGRSDKNAAQRDKDT